MRAHTSTRTCGGGKRTGNLSGWKWASHRFSFSSAPFSAIVSCPVRSSYPGTLSTNPQRPRPTEWRARCRDRLITMTAPSGSSGESAHDAVDRLRSVSGPPNSPLLTPLGAAGIFRRWANPHRLRHPPVRLPAWLTSPGTDRLSTADASCGAARISTPGTSSAGYGDIPYPPMPPPMVIPWLLPGAGLPRRLRPIAARHEHHGARPLISALVGAFAASARSWASFAIAAINRSGRHAKKATAWRWSAL